MDLGELVVDTRWTVGLFGALIRVGAFVAASPMLARRIPATGRLAVVIALGLFLAEPIGRTPTLAVIFEIAITNVAVGLLLGALTGVLLNAFAAAGAFVDVTSGLAIGAVFDPVTGTQSAIFSRFFDQTAMVIFFLVGGDRVLVAGLDASTRSVPVGSGVQLSPAIADAFVERVGLLMLAALEIAAPALAALFLTELVLGLTSRLLPQANVFLVGLPAKQLLAIALGAAVLVAFPTTVQWLVEEVEAAFLAGLGGVRAG